MPLSDPLGDMLTRIRNAQKAGMSSCTTPASKLRANVLEVLNGRVIPTIGIVAQTLSSDWLVEIEVIAAA